jgi:hypothetical protein
MLGAFLRDVDKHLEERFARDLECLAFEQRITALVA